jgi:hypothetical protein
MLPVLTLKFNAESNEIFLFNSVTDRFYSMFPIAEIGYNDYCDAPFVHVKQDVFGMRKGECFYLCNGDADLF